MCLGEGSEGRGGGGGSGEGVEPQGGEGRRAEGGVGGGAISSRHRPWFCCEIQGFAFSFQVTVVIALKTIQLPPPDSGKKCLLVQCRLDR